MEATQDFCCTGRLTIKSYILFSKYHHMIQISLCYINSFTNFYVQKIQKIFTLFSVKCYNRYLIKKSNIYLYSFNLLFSHFFLNSKAQTKNTQMRKTENKITVQQNCIKLYNSHITDVIVFCKQQRMVFRLNVQQIDILYV